MKKLLLLAAFAFSAGFVTAQEDIAVKLLSPTTNIVSGQTFNIDLRVINSGTVNLVAADSLVWAPTINGSLIGNGQGGSVIYLDLVNINAGDSTTLTRQFGLQGGASGSINFCGLAVVFGWQGITESDTTNNTDCNTISYTNSSVSVGEFSLISIHDNSFFANGIYHVDISAMENLDNSTISVINMAGQEVFNAPLENKGGTINTEVALELTNRGVYIVKIADQNGFVKTKKIMF